MLWAMIDRYPGETFLPTGQMIAIPLRNLFLAVHRGDDRDHHSGALSPAHKPLPPVRAHDPNPSGPSLAGAPREFATALALAPGMKGAALTTLRPSGKARFADHVVDVVTEGEFIAAETPVTVIQTDGMRVVVKRLG